MNGKKILLWTVVIFLGWFLVTNPHGAAAAFTSITNGIKGAFASMATFVTSVAP